MKEVKRKPEERQSDTPRSRQKIYFKGAAVLVEEGKKRTDDKKRGR